MKIIKNYFCLKDAISNGISNDNVAIVYGLFCDLIEKTIKTNCRTEQRCIFVL